ncbi:MAG: hypothetical protein JJV97_00330 [SAR324 cluster bacterium]|nr:hypothetical protein [SAR324 cluster bacterium]
MKDNLLFIFGNSDYEREEALTKLTRRFKKTHQLIIFNPQDYIPAEDTINSLSKIIAELTTTTFFKTKYCLLFNNIDKIESKISTTPPPSIKPLLKNLVLYYAKNDFFLSPALYNKSKVIKASHLILKYTSRNQIIKITLPAKFKNKTFIDRPELKITDWLAEKLGIDFNNFHFRHPETSSIWSLIENLSALDSDDLIIIFSTKLKNQQNLTNNWKNIAAKATIKNYSLDYPNSVSSSWIKKIAQQKYQLSLSIDIADLLLELVGPNKQLIISELYKLNLLDGSDVLLNSDTVNKLVIPQTDFVIFKLKELIAHQKISELANFIKIVRQNSAFNLIMINGFLANSFTKLYLLKLLDKSNINLNEISSLTKSPLWLVKKDLAIAHNFTIRELESILMLLANNDIKTKFLPKISWDVFITNCNFMALRKYIKNDAIYHWLPN